MIIVIIIILNLNVGTSKNKDIDHLGKETCAMFNLPIQNKNSSVNVINLNIKNIMILL